MFGDIKKSEKKIPKRRASLLNLKISGNSFYKVKQ